MKKFSRKNLPVQIGILYQKASILTGFGNTKLSHIKPGMNSCRPKGKSIANSILTMFVTFLLIGCASAPVKKVNLKNVLNGTFVYSGPVEGGVPMTVTLKLDSGNRTFQYSEAGGISNRSYGGSFMILGDKVVFTNAAKKTCKHKVSATMNGIKMTYLENDYPIEFGMQPLGGTLEFYKQ